MDTQNISSRNLRSLLVLLIMCGSLVNGAFMTKQDTWLAILFIGVLYLPIILVYIRICRLYPGKGIFDIAEAVFSRTGSMVVTFILGFYSLTVSGLVLQNFAEFTVVISLRSTPSIPIMILILSAALYLAEKGPKTLGSWAFVIFVLILSHFVITLFLSASVMKPSYIFPVMDHSLGEILHNAYAVGCIAVGETMMVMVLFGYTKKEQHPARIYLPAIVIGLIIFTLIILRNLFVLGPVLEMEAQFSTYMTARIIKMGSFLERVESSISIVYILLGITKLSLFLMAASMGTARLFGERDYKRFLLPTGLLILAVSSMVFNNVMEMYDFVWVYSYMAIPFQVILPMIIWIAAEVKVRRESKRKQCPQES